MAEKTLKTKIIHLHGTEDSWKQAKDFVPAQGQIVVYDIDDNYNYERFKIGDGKTLINDLPFATDVKLREEFESHLTDIEAHSNIMVGKKTAEGGIVFGDYESNEVSGKYAVTFGSYNKATGKYTAAFGSGNMATDEGAFVTGIGNTANKGCQVGGNGNTILGKYCFASGVGNHVSENAESSAIYGVDNQILNGIRHLVFGTENIVKNKIGNLVGGKANIINSGDYSVIMGENNIIDNGNKVAIFGTGHHLSSAKTWSNLLVAGRYSKLDSSRHLFVVGNGTSDSNRGNAFEVRSEVNGTGPYVIVGGESLGPANIKDLKKINDKADTTYVDAELAKIDAKLSTVYKYKGSVDTLTYLNDIENPDIGDVYNVRWDEYNEGNNYAWTGTEWEALGSTIDLNNYADKSFVADYISDQGYATEDWVSANYLHYSERQTIASYGASMAEENLEPRFQEIEEDILTLDNRMSDLSSQSKADQTYKPESEKAQSGIAVKEALDSELYTTVEIPSEYISGFSSNTEENLEFYTGIHPIDYIYDELIGIRNLGTVFVSTSDINDMVDLAGVSQAYIEFGENDDYGDPQIIKVIIMKRKYSNTVTTQYFNGGEQIMVEDNVEFIASEPISDLSINVFPYFGPYTCSIIFTISDIDEYSIEIGGDKVSYIGGVPDFKPGETWELNIRNGIVVAGKVEA